MVLLLSHLYPNYHFDPTFPEVVSHEDKINIKTQFYIIIW